MSKIFKQVTFTYIIVYLLLFYLKSSNYITSGFLEASFYSGALNLLNVTAAVILFNYAVRKSNKQFLIFNFGGMTVRMMLLLIIIFVFFKATTIDKYGFIILFFVFYFVLLIFEINHFVLEAKSKNNIGHDKQR